VETNGAASCGPRRVGTEEGSVAWINDPADPTDKPRADLSVADLAVTNLLDACLSAMKSAPKGAIHRKLNCAV